MTSAQVVETSVTNNSSFQNYFLLTITQYEVYLTIVNVMSLTKIGDFWKLATLGPNDLKIGHLGHVCTLYTFSHQTLHTVLVRCPDHFQSKKMSKCHTTFLWCHQIWRHKNGVYLFSNFKPPNTSSERAWLRDSYTENRSSLWQIFLELHQTKEFSPSPRTILFL